jgi:hypothetical protein
VDSTASVRPPASLLSSPLLRRSSPDNVCARLRVVLPTFCCDTCGHTSSLYSSSTRLHEQTTTRTADLDGLASLGICRL